MLIRSATETDIPSIARIHVEGWKTAYSGMVDQGYLDSLSVEKRMEDWKVWMRSGETDVWIAESGAGDPAGFIAAGRMRTAPPGTSSIRPLYSAEIYALYLLSQYWRKGMGKALLQGAAKNLKEKKHKSLCLWVLAENSRACAFYEALGGQKLGKKKIQIGPSQVDEMCYGWRPLGQIL